MSAPAVLVGVLSYAWPGVPGTPMLAQVELPRTDYDPLLRTVGFPRTTLGPCVALVPCARPVHPRTDIDVLAEGLARKLADLLDANTPRMTPLFVEQLQRLSEAALRFADHGVLGADTVGEDA